MIAERRFGISTHIYYGERLNRGHIESLNREPFTYIELFCAIHHFDFHDPPQVAEIAEALRSTGLQVNSLHSPFYTLTPSGERAYYSISSSDEEERRFALAEIKAATALQSFFDYNYLVVHLGPTGERHRWDDVSQGRRSLRDLVEHCGRLSVRVAVENIPNSFSTTNALASLGEDFPEIVFCFDSGHANIEGDPVGTINQLGARIRTTHLHDNLGESDEHRVPYDGSVPWNKVMRALQTQNYTGVFMLEVREGEGENFIARVQSAARKMAAELEDS